MPIACEKAPPKKKSPRSPRPSTEATCGWTIAVRPEAWIDATSAAARSSSPARRTSVSCAPTDTAGLTTKRAAGGGPHGSPGATNRVGTIGSPAARASAR